MKKISIFCLTIWIVLAVNAQQNTQQNTQWKAEWLYGNILKHTKHLEQTVKGPTMGAELSLEWAAFTHKKQWPAFYRYPDIGLSATFLNLGNDSIFGNLAALYPYLRFRLITTQWMHLSMKTGAGVSYLTKTFQDAQFFDPNGTLILGRSNAAIGSHLNVYFAFGGELTVPLGEKLELAGSFNWNHASNGSFYQPNSGINMLNGGVGMRYYPFANRKVVASSALAELAKKTSIRHADGIEE
jgi:hypothetical protein